MQIALSDLKVNVGKYVDLAETEDIIITKYGRPTARIIRFDKEPWYLKQLPEKITSVEQLFGTLPSDIELDCVIAKRVRQDLLLQDAAEIDDDIKNGTTRLYATPDALFKAWGTKNRCIRDVL